MDERKFIANLSEAVSKLKAGADVPDVFEMLGANLTPEETEAAKQLTGKQLLAFVGTSLADVGKQLLAELMKAVQRCSCKTGTCDGCRGASATAHAVSFATVHISAVADTALKYGLAGDERKAEKLRKEGGLN